mmetsp:Transcript_11775/g.30813  ORF Transcript_11775/g.30813 Transcript_11775/m.30813 type:complete len:253 (+) Transcript_11775:142-900(+)
MMRRRLALLALLHATTAQDHPCDLTPATVARINDWILNGNDPGDGAFEALHCAAVTTVGTAVGGLGGGAALRQFGGRGPRVAQFRRDAEPRQQVAEAHWRVPHDQIRIHGAGLILPQQQLALGPGPLRRSVAPQLRSEAAKHQAGHVGVALWLAFRHNASPSKVFGLVRPHEVPQQQQIRDGLAQPRPLLAIEVRLVERRLQEIEGQGQKQVQRRASLRRLAQHKQSSVPRGGGLTQHAQTERGDVRLAARF